MEILIENMAESIELTVRDNGIGRAAAAKLRTDGAGTGLKNIESIIETMNKVNRGKIAFTLTDLYNDGAASGTEVKVFLPHDYSFDFQADRQ